jgi:ribosomal protein S18 acetylase RimI-like enzyme
MNSSERENRTVEVRRCRDPERIASILRRDYFDDPIPLFGDGVLRTFARDWVARRSDVYMHMAEASGAYAGFVFGHTLGPHFWRLFAREHPRHFPSLLGVAAKMRFGGTDAGHAASSISPDKIEAEIGALGIERLQRPFEWPPAGSGSGIIPLLFVSSDFRGRGVAPRLLSSLAAEMFADGAPTVEAHVDLSNLSSARAFMKAGFDVYRMSTEDFWACKRPQDGNERTGAGN